MSGGLIARMLRRPAPERATPDAADLELRVPGGASTAQATPLSMPAAAAVPSPASPGTPPAPAAKPGPGKPTSLKPPSPKPAAKAPAWIAVCVCGLDGETLAQVIDTTSSEAETVGRKVVYVTDLERFDAFRERQVAVEQVVDVEARGRTAPDLPWDLYRLRQFRMLGRKWKPAAVVSFGRAPSPDCLAAIKSWAD